jgi:hypothetical protein
MLISIANFAPHLNPARVEAVNARNEDCIDVGWLAINMLTRADKPEKRSDASGQTMARYGPFTIDLKKVTPSLDFVDFLEACALCDIDKLLKVGRISHHVGNANTGQHKFLRNGDISCLHPYFIHAGHFSVHP